MDKAVLPHDLCGRVFLFAPASVFLSSVAPTCKKFSFDWYRDTLFTHVVIVPDDSPSINAAVNMLAQRQSHSRRGLVAVRPGVYAESVRVTQSCYILGLGPRGSVVVEAPGWESALVSAGLGGCARPEMLGFATIESGEDAFIENLAFQCRNEMMRGRCVYIVNGRLCLLRCDISGTVVISGRHTAPQLTECRIRGSRGNGLYCTDNSRPIISKSEVLMHGHHGVLIDRRSRPHIFQNSISDNQACGIRLFCDGDSTASEYIYRNIYNGNARAELSLTPRFSRGCGDQEESYAEEIDFSNRWLGPRMTPTPA